MAPPRTEPLTRLRFDYTKSPQFRTVHIDGVHGGLSPDGGYFVLSMFSERRPIPQHEEYDVTKEMTLVRDDNATVMRECDVLREVEVCAMLDLATATALQKWLETKIAEHGQAHAHAKAMMARPEVPRE